MPKKNHTTLPMRKGDIMAEDIAEFGPNGNPVRGKIVDGVRYICLTDMAYDAHKRLDTYMASKDTQLFIKELQSIPEFLGLTLVVAQRGGTGASGLDGGTWAVKEIAHNYGQYLSPKYAVFVSRLLVKLEEGKLILVSSDMSVGEMLVAHAKQFLAIERETIRLKAEVAQSRADIVEFRKDNEKLRETLQEHSDILPSIVEHPSATGYISVTGFSRLKGQSLPLELAKMLGVAAKKLAEQYGEKVGKVPDERFGKVNSYPAYVLEEAYVQLWGGNNPGEML